MTDHSESHSIWERPFIVWDTPKLHTTPSFVGEYTLLPFIHTCCIPEETVLPEVYTVIMESFYICVWDSLDYSRYAIVTWRESGWWHSSATGWFSPLMAEGFLLFVLVMPPDLWKGHGPQGGRPLCLAGGQFDFWRSLGGELVRPNHLPSPWTGGLDTDKEDSADSRKRGRIPVFWGDSQASQLVCVAWELKNIR